ncbi:MAG: glutamate racemase [Anaerolineales bacterium]|nr:glutamate racemase [Anaerolineales bacterium]
MQNLRNTQHVTRIIIALMPSTTHPIGVFDSGVGGLSVLRAMRAQMPEESILYFGDQGHVPYGPRSMEQIQSFSEGITKFLLNYDSKLIVVACNTASAAALTYLRGRFPAVSFVGMEPAVKPAAETTKTGKVGVLATPATFQGALYASVVERFAAGVELFQHTCPGLVSQIEKGDLDSSVTRAILEDALRPMLEKNIDTVVLGCTHYPFVIPLIEQIVGDAKRVRVIDPAPSVAKQVKRLLEAAGTNVTGISTRQSQVRASVRFFTSGNPSEMKSMLPILLGESGEVESITWKNDREVEITVPKV